MTENKFLLVEGRDDQHVVWALVNHHAVPETFKVEDKKGIDNLLKTFPVLAKGSQVQALAILVDADANVLDRWQQIRSIITNLGYSSCPEDLPKEGLIVDKVDSPRIGAWIMPDNSLGGMLEDFISYLVPDGDKLWTHVSKTMQEMPEGLAEFKEGHASKAKIHTWLAWKDEPGTPMGLAITKRWLNPEAKSADPFLTWIRRMYAD